MDQVRSLFDEIIMFLPKRVCDAQTVSEQDIKFIMEEVCNVCKEGESYLRSDVHSDTKEMKQALVSGHQIHDKILLFMWYVCGILELHDDELLYVSHRFPQNNAYRTGTDALLYYVLHSHDKYERGHRGGAYTDSPIDFSRLVLLVSLCAIMSSNSIELRKSVDKYVNLRKLISQSKGNNTHEDACTCRLCVARNNNIRELTEVTAQIRACIPSQCNRVLEHIQKHINKHNVSFPVYSVFISMFSYMNYDAFETHGCRVDVGDSYRDVVKLQDLRALERTLSRIPKGDKNKTKAVLQVSYRDFSGMAHTLVSNEPLLKRDKSYKFRWL